MTIKGLKFYLWLKHNSVIQKIILVLSITLLSQGCTTGQAQKDPEITAPLPEPMPVFSVISSDLFRTDDDITEVPIQWSKDSKDFYYLTYQSDQKVPLEIWKFDGYQKEKVAQFDYRDEYNTYHLGVFVKRSSWSPANEMLGFVLEIGWGGVYQFVILNVNTGKTELVDEDVFDFDWYPEENKLALVKVLQSEPLTLDPTVEVYDLEKHQSKKLTTVSNGVWSIAFDHSGNLFVTELALKRTFRMEQEKKILVGPGETLLPSLDRTRIGLISDYTGAGKMIGVHDSSKEETKEIIRGDFRRISWGEGNTLQLVMNQKILFIRDETVAVEALFPLAPSPNNKKFLVATESHSVDLVSINVY